MFNNYFPNIYLLYNINKDLISKKLKIKKQKKRKIKKLKKKN